MTRPTGIVWLALIGAACALLALAPAAAVAMGTASITLPFDHLTTGFELDGVHRDLPCEACHLNAIFRGTPRGCGSCHITGSPFNATPKAATHISSSNTCVACHNAVSFVPTVHFDHAEVLGGCVSCHNGKIAQGEGPGHLASSQNCVACHTVVSWNPPKTIDHTQIPLALAGRCIVCHNGAQASGKPVGHPTTNAECGDCHLTTTWLGAKFDHSGISSGCFSCHNGSQAVGKQGGHMPTTNRCEACHTTGIGTSSPSWAPSAFDHTQMTVSTCQSCHSGSVKISTGLVSGQPANHLPPIPSSIDCGVCHVNTPAAETWTALTSSIATLHTGLPASNCRQCHGGQTFAGLPAPYVPMSIAGESPTHAAPLAPPHIPVLSGADCSACHAVTYQAAGFGPATAMNAARHAFVATTCNTCHEAGLSFYPGAALNLQGRPADHTLATMAAPNDCGGCHTTANWNSNTMPAGHMPNPGNQPCLTCHTAAPTNYTTLAANTVLHTGISSGCITCHGSPTGALTFYKNLTPKSALLSPPHIPTANTPCEDCHSRTLFTSFSGTTMNAARHTLMFAFIGSTCDACHNGPTPVLSFYGVSNLQTRPGDHNSGNEATQDCSKCHNVNDWGGNTQRRPASTAAGTRASKPPVPSGTAAVESVPLVSSRATTAAASGVAARALPTPYSHVGVLGTCASCHNGVAANGKPAAHIASNERCENCHTTIAWLPARFDHQGVTARCVSCHNAVLAAGRPVYHVPTNRDCSTCHGTISWLPARFTHLELAGTCRSCHNAMTAPGQPQRHLATTLDCGSCHNTSSWMTTRSAMPQGAISPAERGTRNGVRK